MKKQLLSLSFLALANIAFAQIIITSNDLPVSGDTLRSTAILPVGVNLNLSNTGANINWDYSALTPFSQSVDRYKTAAQVNPVYALTISPTAFGYLVADSLSTANAPVQIPLAVTNIYTFFNRKNSPSRYIAEAFAASVSMLPVAANYSDEDEWYFLPLAFNDQHNSTFKLNVSVLSFGSLKIEGTRSTTVDGYGTIKTPFFTTGVPCIRVRSEVNEVDSFSAAGTTFGFPRKTVEYKWLTLGEHYPALWVVTDETTGTPVTSSARFRDNYRQGLLSITEPQSSIQFLEAYPVPAKGNKVYFKTPESWKAFTVAVFDQSGKIVAHASSQNEIDIQGLAAGNYFGRIISGNHTGYIHFVKE